MSKTDRQLQIDSLLKRAEDGVQAVFESSRYKDYLCAMSKFHNYSARNISLILNTKPEASLVAGYVAWQNKFNRQVKKGEQGIPIIGYAPKTITSTQIKKDESGKPILDQDGKPIEDVIKQQIPSFAVVYVYDISQTVGEPLPTFAKELSGQVENYTALLTALSAVSLYKISYAELPDNIKGVCSHQTKTITIQQGLSEVHTIHTIIHEITHADLHGTDSFNILDQKDRRTKEIEAESTAYVVCNKYGLDTSSYSFDYLASWSANKELKELQNSLDTIQTQANELITRIDVELARIANEHMLSDIRLVAAYENVYPTPIRCTFYENGDYNLISDIPSEVYQKQLEVALSTLNMTAEDYHKRGVNNDYRSLVFEFAQHQRTEAILDAVRHDSNVDLSQIKTRPKLTENNLSVVNDRFAAAREKAAQQNISAKNKIQVKSKQEER